MKPLPQPVIDHLRTVVAAAGQPDLSNTKYRLCGEIASGGMGTVYLAEDTELKRRVALKVNHASTASGESAHRTMQEALLIARMEHPGIVPIHDAGTLPDGRIYYVMKYIEGKRFDEAIRESRSQNEMLRLFQRVCETMAFAHSHGVIHRDLKPQNIMTGNFGEVLVMDWGTAKMLPSPTAETEPAPIVNNVSVAPRPTVAGDTASGTIIGTPGYMAPEQRDGRVQDQDIRTDIFALGGILHYIVHGVPPGEPESAMKHPHSSKAKILEAICSKAHAADPDRRYASARELGEEINNYLDGLPVTAYRETVIERSVRWLGRNKVLVWMIISYLVMRAFVLLFFGR